MARNDSTSLRESARGPEPGSAIGQTVPHPCCAAGPGKPIDDCQIDEQSDHSESPGFIGFPSKRFQ